MSSSAGTKASAAATDASPRPRLANCSEAPGGTRAQGVDDDLRAPAFDESNDADSSATWVCIVVVHVYVCVHFVCTHTHFDQQQQQLHALTAMLQPCAGSSTALNKRTWLPLATALAFSASAGAAEPAATS